ncbi:hypothetical protein SAY87_001402 [Trapa incisa]|uniref:Uncharacterized protein n=1 Tax=Trapa incisa TaxID=236973 RepID=A0AAN7GGQ9_9MYRT|nr:hypothetical protein SAY87_001402 [Trapa incisa]
MSESPLPKGNSPEAREGDKARRCRVGDEAAAAAAEIVSEYSEMCGAASGSLSTTTRVAATEKIDREVTRGDIREPRRERRVNADRYRSPVKAQSKRSSAAGLTLVSRREGAAWSEEGLLEGTEGTSTQCGVSRQRRQNGSTVNSLALAGGWETMDEERRENTAEETDGATATVPEEGSESLIENPHV